MSQSSCHAEAFASRVTGYCRAEHGAGGEFTSVATTTTTKTMVEYCAQFENIFTNKSKFCGNNTLAQFCCNFFDCNLNLTAASQVLLRRREDISLAVFAVTGISENPSEQRCDIK